MPPESISVTILIIPYNFEKLRIIRYHTGKLTETHPTRSKIIQISKRKLWKLEVIKSELVNPNVAKAGGLQSQGV
jgi:hypothetical protein